MAAAAAAALRAEKSTNGNNLVKRFSRRPPSNIKSITDPKTGIKYAPRDMSSLSSVVNISSSLIKFGEEIYNKHQGSGDMFLTYDYAGKGMGYVVYSIGEEEVVVTDIYADCINPKEDRICFDALVETLFNTCKSMNKTMVIETESKDFDRFARGMNQVMKEQKIEDKNWWKIG